MKEESRKSSLEKRSSLNNQAVVSVTRKPDFLEGAGDNQVLRRLLGEKEEAHLLLRGMLPNIW